MHLDQLDISNRFSGKVVANELVSMSASTPDDEDSDEVRELVLDIGVPTFALDVGQSVGVLAPGQRDFGQEHHLRLYSVADLPEIDDAGHTRIKLCVKRCSYIDDYSGERYRGIASNFLCDRRPGDNLALTGPYGLPFEIPPENNANIILIATSTGIAPFRAFVRHLFENIEDFEGRVWLFYGARTGLDLIYLNQERDDFAQYYNRETFEAFKVLSPRPQWHDDLAWGETLNERGQELWNMLSDSKTYVYVAGLESVQESLDQVFADIAGSDEQWQRRKAELIAGKRWVELLY